VALPGFIPAAFPTDPLLGGTDQLASDPVTATEFQWYLFRCAVDRAWGRVTGKGVVIADVDAGFFPQHQDLAAKVELNHAHNSFDGSSDVTAGAQTDHGTAVLGLAGAASNNLGIVGVAFDADLWPIQTDAGKGAKKPGDPVANAIDWVIGEKSGGRRVVINVESQTDTMGNCEQAPAVNAAIRHAISQGFVVCVAAGNGDRDAGIADDGSAIPPTGSILVGATAYHPTSNPRAAVGGEASNWGPRIVVSAPGDRNHDVTCDTGPIDSYRNNFGGTSGAAAKVAGVIALMLEANPRLTHEQVKEILVRTGSPLPTDKPIGVFLNADGAVAAAFGAAPPT
jgi:subtilisin family serine protease